MCVSSLAKVCLDEREGIGPHATDLEDTSVWRKHVSWITALPHICVVAGFEGLAVAGS